LAGVVAGVAWSPWFPINKNLWTSSYVLFTGGLAAASLAVCYWWCDIEPSAWRWRGGSTPRRSRPLHRRTWRRCCTRTLRTFRTLGTVAPSHPDR